MLERVGTYKELLAYCLEHKKTNISVLHANSVCRTGYGTLWGMFGIVWKYVHISCGNTHVTLL